MKFSYLQLIRVNFKTPIVYVFYACNLYYFYIQWRSKYWTSLVFEWSFSAGTGHRITILNRTTIDPKQSLVRSITGPELKWKIQDGIWTSLNHLKAMTTQKPDLSSIWMVINQIKILFCFQTVGHLVLTIQKLDQKSNFLLS